MSKPGTTWFTTKRKLTALVAGAAILAGTVGAASPAPETESARGWSRVEISQQVDADVVELDAKIKLDPKTSFSFSARSTWS